MGMGPVWMVGNKKASRVRAGFFSYINASNEASSIITLQ
jgi:hypothetical protein